MPKKSIEQQITKEYCQTRAVKAQKILAAFYDRYDISTSVVDVLADLMHLSQALGRDFDEFVDSAKVHFEAEEIGGEHA